MLNAIDLATGVQTAALSSGAATLSTATGQTASSINASGQLKISTGVSADLSITGTGNALNVLGLAGNTGTATAFTAARTSGIGGISGKTLTFTSFNGGTAVNVTFGDGTNGTVKSLDQLNQTLQANNLSATIDANGVLTVSATNDYASSTLGSTAAGGSIGGTVTSALTWSTASSPVADPVAQAARASLVSQYNNILAQIDTTSQDSSFNGVNLLNGDQLKLVFDETGKSSLNITGVTFNSAGLGLSKLVNGVDFIDNAATNKVLTSLNAGSSTLAVGSVDPGFEPVDRAGPSGLQQEPDQRAADRFVQPDAGRHQRGSGEQPGAVDPPVDRGLGAVAGQPVAAERVAAPALSGCVEQDPGGGGSPAAFYLKIPEIIGRRPARRALTRAMRRPEDLCPRHTLKGDDDAVEGRVEAV